MHHHSDMAPVLDAGRVIAIQQGHDFAAEARKAFAAGERIPDGSLRQVAAATAATMQRDATATLFEAGFTHAGVGVKMDIFYATRGYRVMRETKASKTVSQDMLDDCAIQLWTARGAGADVRAVEVAFINPRYRKGSTGRRGKLVLIRRVTAEVEARLALVPDWIEQARAILALPTAPAANPSHACEYPVAEKAKRSGLDLLARGKERNLLAKAGYTDVLSIPLHELTKPQNLTVAKALHTGAAYVSPELRELIVGMPLPCSYLDFETVAHSVPVFAGAAPYEQVPVQFSCHARAASGTLSHREFLWGSLDSPEAAFADALLAAVGDTGPVYVYGSFEGTVIKRLANRLPQLSRALMRVKARLVDLLPLVRAGYYHPDMDGSYSIKAVLPTLPGGVSHADLAGDVRCGTDIQEAWMRYAVSQDALEREQLSRSLRAYCGLDTLAMVQLVAALSGHDEACHMEQAA